MAKYLDNKKFEQLIIEFQQIKRDVEKYKLLKESYLDTENRLTKKKKIPKYWKYDPREEAKLNNKYKVIETDLSVMFWTLSWRLTLKAKWATGYTGFQQDDAIQEGVIICFEKLDRFDPTKGKAFNYMTTCILNHFRGLYRIEKTISERVASYYKHVYNSQPQNLKNQ